LHHHPARLNSAALEECVTTNSSLKILVLGLAIVLAPQLVGAQSTSEPRDAAQQSNVPDEVRQAEQVVERTARRLRMGLEGAVGVDPELIMFGTHAAFGPIFTAGLDVRPGVEFGIGELTTLFGINVDVLYALPGGARRGGWAPYVGAGPNFALSHQGFEADGEGDNRSRFDFSDTDFEGGMNFIAGARHRTGMFLELKTTAYGVSNVRFLVGYNF
jgi:hypothetical protein